MSLARWVQRYGYELVRADAHRRAARPSDFDYDFVPRGRDQPFSTAEYDVLPRGQFDVVRHDYYSPIPDLSQLPEEVWLRPRALPGVELDTGAGIDFVERELTPFIAELEVPLDGPRQPGVFYLHNSGFESVDAELLYGMIRSSRPQRVIELGSGYTTLLINMAAQRNEQEGVSTHHVAYDPYPREYVLGTSLGSPTRLETVSATELPLATFEELKAGDILFVDTTHTVKLGSDVNFILLDVLPRLQPGVLVHFHDIFLPWEYPRRWFEEMRYYWAEQYLLQAFLVFNREFAVLVPAHAIARTHPERLRRAIPSFGNGVSPGSMWLKRCAGVR